MSDGVSSIATTLYDWAPLLGPRVEFIAWRQQFCRGRSDASAIRTWERSKKDLRDLDVPFTLAPKNGSARRGLVFKSSEFMREECTRLIGEPEFYSAHMSGHMQRKVRAFKARA